MFYGTIAILLLAVVLFASSSSKDEGLITDPTPKVTTSNSPANNPVTGTNTPRPNIVGPGMNFDTMRAPEGFRPPSTQPMVDWQNAYLNLHKQADTYWVTGHERSEVIEQMKIESTKVKEHGDRLRDLLIRYKDTNDLSRRIYGEFNDFRIMIFANGSSRSLTLATSTKELKPFDPSQIEICYIPASQVNHASLFPNNCYYRKEWSAVMMRAINMPEEMMIAIFYHELGHALRHRVDKAPSATAPPHTDEYIREEVEMHMLELEVMDAATNGAFTDLLDNIIDRTWPNPPGYFSPRIYATVNNVTAQDLVAYDRMFKLASAGQSMISVATFQFKLSLLFRITDRFAPPENRKEVKINLYRWVTGTPRQPPQRR